MNYFTPDTMSVHLKADVEPYAKRGSIKKMRLEKIGEEKLTDKELLRMAHEILEHAKSGQGFIEMERGGATVVQLGSLRIAIATPPFSDGVEITAVRPIAKLSLEEYAFSKSPQGPDHREAPWHPGRRAAGRRQIHLRPGHRGIPLRPRVHRQDHGISS